MQKNLFVKKEPSIMSNDVTAERTDLSILWLAAAGVFLLFYVSGASNLNNFEIDNWSYVLGRDMWGAATGNLSKCMMLYFDPQQLSSIMWRVFFLFPALLCFSIWICHHHAFAERLVAFLSRFLEAKTCPFAAVVLSFVAILVLIVFVTQGKPLVDDEYAYVFQAQTYLTGHIAMPPPPGAKSFSDFHILTHPVWAGKYLFGHPAFLAIGVALGSPYVASVAMSLASLALLLILGIRTGTRHQAAIATWLLALSPWFWFTSASLLSHASTLLLFLITAIGWTALEKRPSMLIGLGVGLCMGWSFAVRPLTAILLAIPFAYLTLKNLRKNAKDWSRAAVALTAGGLSVFGLVLLYDKAITGNALQMPFALYWPGETVGFGQVLPIGQLTPIEHTPLKGIMNLAVSSIKANSWFLGWPLSFLPLLGLLAIGYARNQIETEKSRSVKWTSWDSLWVSIIVVFCVGYTTYYSSGVSDTGPVYYYELLVPLTLLSAKGILTAHRALGNTRLKSLKYFVPVFCLISTIGALVFFVPEKAIHNRKISELAYYPFEMAEKKITGKAVVFVGRRPQIGWLYNRPQPSPKLDDRILFVRLLDDAANEAVIRGFPDRKPYQLTHDWKRQQFTISPYSAR